MLLDPPLVHAPPFPRAPWIQTPSPVRLEDLRGQVVVVHFWDFTCINCLRTLPYLRAWLDRYADIGLGILGIHTPEFTFARDGRQVTAAVGRLGIRWPVLLDNEQQAWTSYGNRCWPTMYLLDARGYIRFKREGEGAYVETERTVQSLLREVQPEVPLLPLLEPLRADDDEGAVCFPASAELQVDSLAGGPPPPRQIRTYYLPSVLEEGSFYAQGDWTSSTDGLTLVGPTGAAVLLFHAADVFAVLSPAPEPDRLPLDPVWTRIELDGEPLPIEHYGSDVFQDGGRAWTRVDAPRLYHLAARLPPVRRRLGLHVSTPGWTVYAFSFGTCLVPPHSANESSQEAMLC